MLQLSHAVPLEVPNTEDRWTAHVLLRCGVFGDLLRVIPVIDPWIIEDIPVILLSSGKHCWLGPSICELPFSLIELTIFIDGISELFDQQLGGLNDLMKYVFEVTVSCLMLHARLPSARKLLHCSVERTSSTGVRGGSVQVGKLMSDLDETALRTLVPAMLDKANLEPGEVAKWSLLLVLQPALAAGYAALCPLVLGGRVDMAGCGDEIMVSLCIPPDVGCVYQGDAVGPCDGEGVSFFVLVETSKDEGSFHDESECVTSLCCFIFVFVFIFIFVFVFVVIIIITTITIIISISIITIIIVTAITSVTYLGEISPQSPC
jgi:hypothetical protein